MKKVLLLLLVATSVFAQNKPKVRDDYYSGLLGGQFSVSPTQTVRFSKGNLQFNTSKKIWQFADHQYDIIGSDPDQWGGKALETLDGWIDMLYWGQNGYEDMYPGSHYSPTVSVDGNSPFDWGQEPISNGGSFNNMWRTLSINEWRYLFNDRKDAKKKFSTATVCGVKGIVILPDNWFLPPGCSFNEENATFEKDTIPDTLFNDEWYMGGWKIEPSNYTKNIYNQTQWERMENNGAVFLPADIKSNGGSRGFYWSSTADEKGIADVITFIDDYVYTFYEEKFITNGLSVRLVQNETNMLDKSEDSFGTRPIIISEIDHKIEATFETLSLAGGWIMIYPEAYLETSNGIKAKLISTEGISLSPEKTVFSDDIESIGYRFKLIFEALPEPLESYDSFSIIEGGDSSWKWTDIRIFPDK